MEQSKKIGCEEHKRLLIKTIEKLHEANALVTSPREKHSFELVAWPVNASKRYLWDLRGAKGYEAQISARKGSVEVNMNRDKLWRVPMEWVTEKEETKEGINKC